MAAAFMPAFVSAQSFPGTSGASCTTNADCNTAGGYQCDTTGTHTCFNATGTGGAAAVSGSSGSVGSVNCETGTTKQNGLCLPNNGFNTGIAGSTSLTDLIVKVLNILLTLAGVVAIIMIVVGGLEYITSGGNEEQSEKGKKALVNAVIGLVVVLLSFAVVRVISSTLTSQDVISTSSTYGQ